jgi:hypothetical protein
MAPSSFENFYKYITPKFEMICNFSLLIPIWDVVGKTKFINNLKGHGQKSNNRIDENKMVNR